MKNSMKFLITSLLITVFSMMIVQNPISAQESPIESSAPVPTCVPTGTLVTDIYTGESYLINIPTDIGFDNCGNPVPDICVNWGPDQVTGNDYISTLWTFQPCLKTTPEEAVDPETVTPPSCECPAEAPQLPSTGFSTTSFYLLVIALFFTITGIFLVGTSLVKKTEITTG